MTIIGQLTGYIFGPPIHRAAFRGDLKKLEALIKAGTDPNSRESSELTPLMLATQKGHKDIAEFLLSHGADVNAKTKIGFTALFNACIVGILELPDFSLITVQT
jgi:ankyrin repeat protein